MAQPCQVCSIRPLQISELGLLEQGANEDFLESKMSGRFDFPRFARHWAEVIISKSGVILGLFGPDGKIHGAIGGRFFPDSNTADTVGSLDFWYVRRPYRGRGLLLLKRLEQCAIEAGCARMFVTHFVDRSERLELAFKRMGYRPIEVHYLRDFK